MERPIAKANAHVQGLDRKLKIVTDMMGLSECGRIAKFVGREGFKVL